MTEYYGTKRIAAVYMTRAEYNEYRGWVLPDDEDGTDDGYLVEYLDGGKPNDSRHEGYISWSPKAQFENAYQPTTAMSFGHAITALEAGEKVARSGWNGKGMFLYYVDANNYPAQTKIAADAFRHHPLQDEDDGAVVMVPYSAYIAMKTAQDNVVPWLASQTDVLAKDWCIIEDGENNEQ